MWFCESANFSFRERPISHFKAFQTKREKLVIPPVAGFLFVRTALWIFPHRHCFCCPCFHHTRRQGFSLNPLLYPSVFSPPKNTRPLTRCEHNLCFSSLIWSRLCLCSVNSRFKTSAFSAEWGFVGTSSWHGNPSWCRRQWRSCTKHVDLFCCAHALVEASYCCLFGRLAFHCIEEGMSGEWGGCILWCDKQQFFREQLQRLHCTATCCSSCKENKSSRRKLGKTYTAEKKNTFAPGKSV